MLYVILPFVLPLLLARPFSCRREYSVGRAAAECDHVFSLGVALES